MTWKKQENLVLLLINGTPWKKKKKIQLINNLQYTININYYMVLLIQITMLQ